ncbi:hypothetical protein OHC33_002626 [Knufia fluminis]|uniref:Pyridoxamine 5'-phosphate oxidase N-terminal domain-containing protein n=1 Tax=Knufia fluminis TaxID=191047 RepID=A0AAN8F3V0_9EURO|nr:hypothetical protein OHC33_002626 [Knufia fluminis]
MSQNNPPLNYEPSLSGTNQSTSTTLPPEVSQCLKNARYLHLATIAPPITPSDPPAPHVSLMNYTFLPSYSWSNSTPGPVILMTTNTQSLKTQNLRHNPKVSLLVHDWSSHRPPTATTSTSTGENRSGSPPAAARGSSLASLLLNLNTSALSSISTTISGEARFLDSGSDEEKWCKEAHLANNTFEGQLSTEAGYFGGAVQPMSENVNGDAGGYIEGNDVRVVLVPVRTGRISDFKGGVRDWQIVDGDGAGGNVDDSRGRTEGLVNGAISS